MKLTPKVIFWQSAKWKFLAARKFELDFRFIDARHCQMIIWYQQSFAKINMMICKFHQNRSREPSSFKAENLSVLSISTFLFIHIISQKLWFNHSEWRILHQDCKKTFLTKSLFGCLYLFSLAYHTRKDSQILFPFSQTLTENLFNYECFSINYHIIMAEEHVGITHHA